MDTKDDKDTITLIPNSNYLPLIILTLQSAIVGYAIMSSVDGGMLAWMHYTMGYFLTIFAMLKLFNIKAFANGFQMYDLIAIRYPHYAKAYPFIELLLGLGFLSFFIPILIYFLTIGFMVIGVMGVHQALKSGLDINCPCMGSIIKVPLSTVTLVEDIAMGVMAFIMLIMTIFN